MILKSDYKCTKKPQSLLIKDSQAAGVVALLFLQKTNSI